MRLDTATVARIVATPYRAGGDQIGTGWDCWGCVAWGLQNLFGLDVRAWRKPDDTTATMALAAHHGAWREAEALAPGVVIAALRDGRVVHHVGLLLSATHVMHCSEIGTRIETIAALGPDAKFYEPRPCC